MKSYFRWVGWFEGSSLIALLFFAMPMKHLWNDPSWVKSVGPIHGLLFLIYVFTAFSLSSRENWSKKKILICLVLSSVPFGTFVFERKYL
ncbi:MAG: DUF3817 domain-containing protein [Bdellovibrionales bacterium]|nr:DUF3817 domain-containing protein [Bdellovibrionales bacterium]